MKKLVLAVLVGIFCLGATSAFAQKKGLIKGALDALSSKTPALSARIQRQVARASLRAHTIPYASAANIPTATAVLSLERVKAEALHPQVDISKLVPIRPTKPLDLTNRALLNVQKSLQKYGTPIPNCHILPGQREEKVLLLDFYTLLLKDIRGELTPKEQTQLRYLFWHTNTSISSVERKLQSWYDRYGDTPTLPKEEILPFLKTSNVWTLDWVQEEWALAADIYMLQKLYGSSLPKRLQNAQVIPLKERQIVLFRQKLKKAQKTIETLRTGGDLNRLWMKDAFMDVYYDDANKLAYSVQVFYFYFLDKYLNIFPRAKYLKTSQAGRIYEIPVQEGLQLLEPAGIKTVKPEEYVVFQADGANAILLKWEDIELLTNPSAYEEEE